MENSTIKNKQLQFTHNETTFRAKIKYDTSKFGYSSTPPFWEIKLYQVDDIKLQIPITYHFAQSRGWLLKIPKFREHSYICTSRRKEIENKTSLYPLVKEQIIYQWFNRKVILKYEAQINNFNFLIEQKYNKKLVPLKEQKRELKQQLRSGKINNKQYQKLYTPIRKQKDKIEFHIWNICRSYKKRYFICDKLKQIYRAV